MNRHFQYWLILVVLLSSFPDFCTAQHFEKEDERFFIKGNTFTFQSRGFKDTMTITDPVTGKSVSKVMDAPQPVTMNGKKIYETDEVSTPSEPANNNVSFEEYILNSFKAVSWVRSLRDGVVRIHLNHLVIDENGKIVYYAFKGVRYKGLDNQIRSMANAPVMKPATLNGSKVISRLNIGVSNYTFEIKDHTVTCTKDNLLSGKSKF